MISLEHFQNIILNLSLYYQLKIIYLVDKFMSIFLSNLLLTNIQVNVKQIKIFHFLQIVIKKIKI